MARRSKDWNVGLAEDLRDPEFAREFLLAAIDEGVPAGVLTASLYERFSSRGEAEFQNKVLSAMRYAFGGHLEKPAK